MSDDLLQRAREICAASYERAGYRDLPIMCRDGELDATVPIQAALAALASQSALIDELVEELKVALEWLEIDPIAEARGVVASIQAALAKVEQSNA